MMKVILRKNNLEVVRVSWRMEDSWVTLDMRCWDLLIGVEIAGMGRKKPKAKVQ